MNSPLQSFWLGGFESGCHINRFGQRLDMIALTGHDQQTARDYVLLQSIGIHSVRDGVRWHLIDRRSRFDFSSFAPMLEAAEQTGMQVIWTLCHYGWPLDCDILDPTFPRRFAEFAHAVARFVRAHSSTVPFYTPVNEISFLAWGAGSCGFIYPFSRKRGDLVKKQFIRAAIAACGAIHAADPRARFVHTDPIINIVARRDAPNDEEVAQRRREFQFEALDGIAGRRHPELGGDPRYLDIIGLNYYHDNQFEHDGVTLPWYGEPLDDRWVPLHQLLDEVGRRYNRPILLAETSHFGDQRAEWIRTISREIQLALTAGVPLIGACIYPIIDRPGWECLSHWHRSGLWDLSKGEDRRLSRTPAADPIAEFLEAQRAVGTILGVQALGPGRAPISSASSPEVVHGSMRGLIAR